MAQTAPLTPQQVRRYSRHIIMPQVGSRGQRKLLESKVVIIGAGGLGSPSAIYLALAGVGTIGLVDFDAVELSNLQRQTLHHSHDVGRPKVLSAQETIHRYNPDVKVILHPTRLTSENALETLAPYDVVVNGADNFPTRYLLNDACYFLRKPLVDGSILMFDGQATVFLPGKGCYRCLFPEPPPPGSVPNCAEAGVLGAMTGIVGSIQATEALKLLLGVGSSLAGRLLLLDALTMEVRTVRLRRNPGCVLCGDHPTVTRLIDYEAFCGVPAPASTATGSLKDRIAKSMIERAEREGKLAGDKVVLEPTSGNTGISLAMVCKVKGYKLLAVMPESVSPERLQVLRAFGAQVHFTDGKRGTNYSIAVAQEMLAKEPGRYFMPYQYGNEANPLAHYETTGREILEALPQVDVFVAGLGTGGTLMGVGRRLKEHNPGVKVVAAAPDPEDYIEGLRKLEEGFIPPILDLSLLDARLLVGSKESFYFTKELLEREGIFAGISSGAVIAAALRYAQRLERGNIVCFLADGGWKYLSTDLWTRDYSAIEKEVKGKVWW